MRVNFNVPDELLQRIDKYAKDNYMTRSSLMCQACDQYLTAKEMQKLFSNMSDTFSTLKEKIEKNEDCKLDEETLKQIEYFEGVSKMLSGQKRP